MGSDADVEAVVEGPAPDVVSTVDVGVSERFDDCCSTRCGWVFGCWRPARIALGAVGGGGGPAAEVVVGAADGAEDAGPFWD